MRVCLIEDNAALRDALALALEDRGFTVFPAPNGIAGLESVKRNAPDVVVTDMEMPGLGGLGVIQRVRAYHPQIRIVAMSGSRLHEPQDLMQALAQGADTTLSKPFRVDTLVDAITTLANERSKSAKTRAQT